MILKYKMQMVNDFNFFSLSGKPKKALKYFVEEVFLSSISLGRVVI